MALKDFRTTLERWVALDSFGSKQFSIPVEAVRTDCFVASRIRAPDPINSIEPTDFER